MKRISTKTPKKMVAVILAALAACSIMGRSVEKTVTTTEKHSDANGDIVTTTTTQTTNKEDKELITYEFETFNNVKVVIDENSIIAQESSQDPEYSDLVSAEAAGNIIAPGRDFVYLEDANNYYVADYSRNLITVADKNKVQVKVAKTAEEIEGVGDLIEETNYAIFDNNVFTFRYDPEYFVVMEDEECVIVSFYNEEIQTAGSDTIMYTEKENADAMEVAKEYAKQYCVDEDSVQETNLGTSSATAYSFSVSPTDEAASGNKTRAMACAVTNGDNVIVIEVLTHVEPDEGMDMFVNDKIAEVLDTFSIY